MRTTPLLLLVLPLATLVAGPTMAQTRPVQRTFAFPPPNIVPQFNNPGPQLAFPQLEDPLQQQSPLGSVPPGSPIPQLSPLGSTVNPLLQPPLGPTVNPLPSASGSTVNPLQPALQPPMQPGLTQF
jgi:hypothetical protein